MKSKSNPFQSSAISGGAVVLACFCMLNLSAQAQGTWIGGQGNNDTDNAANWVGGVVFPKNFTNVTFDNNVVNGLVSINEFPFFTGGLTLTSGLTQDITITGLTLFTGDDDINMSAAGANLTVNSTLAMYGAAHPSVWIVGTGRTLTFNNNVNSGSKGFIKEGAGTVALNYGNNNSFGTIINGGTLSASNADSLGQGDVVINNSGTLYINQQWVLHGLNPYTNPTGVISGVTNVTVNAGGQLALDPTNGFANGVANLYLNGGSVTGGNNTTTYGALFLYNGNQQITAGGATTSTISTSLGLTGNNNTITVGAGSALNITNVLQDGQWGAGGLIKAGAGTQALSGANTYTGDTTINGGTLQVAGAGSLGSGSYAGAISIDSGANLQFSSSADQTFSGIVSGPGSLTKDTSNSTLYLSGANTNTGAATVSAGVLKYANVAAVGSTSGITVNGTGSVWFDPGTTGGTISTPISLIGDGGGNCALNTYTPNGQVTFSGPITMTGSSLIRAIGDNSTINFTNAIHGTGDFSFAAFGGGGGTKDFIVLSGASDFSGGFALVNWYGAVQATLSGGDNRLPTTALVTVRGGGGLAGALDLNGNNQTIAGLTDTLGFGGLDAGARSVVNTSGTAVTLTLNTTADQSSGATIGGTDINGTIGNNLALVKSGTATQTLSGANAYSGNTTVTGGTLSLGQVNSNNESSTVSITASAGAKLDLAFGGTDTVDKLYINGVQQPIGDYTSVHVSGAFTGGGTLHVTSGPVGGYASWKAVNAPTGTPSDDYDGDGVGNGSEYVLGGTKDTNDLSKLPAISTSGANMVFTFQRAQASIDGTTNVAIQVGTNLSTWPDSYNVPGAAQVNNPGVTVVKDTSVGFDTVTLIVPRAPDAKKFARLVVTPAP